MGLLTEQGALGKPYLAIWRQSVNGRRKAPGN